MLFQFVYVIATLVAILCAAFSVITPRIFWFAVLIAVFPLANIYVAGVSLALVLTALVFRTPAANISVRHLAWFGLLWGIWFVWAIGGYFAHGISARQVFQSFEFLLYGLIGALSIALLRYDSNTTRSTVRACVVGAFLLAVVCLIAHTTTSTWPSYLIGRNEAAYIIVVLGLIPSIFLIFGMTDLGRRSSPRIWTLGCMAVMMLAIAEMSARGALICGVTLLLGVSLFAVLKRNVGRTVLISLALIPTLGATVLLGGYLPELFDSPTSFSNLERLNLLVASYQLFLAEPWLGWGWGSIDLLMPTVRETVLSYPHPHNTFARFAVEMGIGGIMFLILMFGRIFWRASQLTRRGFRVEGFWAICAAGAIFLLGMIDVIFYGASRAIPTMLILAIIEALPVKTYILFPTSIGAVGQITSSPCGNGPSVVGVKSK